MSEKNTGRVTIPTNLDERFQREKGKEIFPKEWADCERCRLDIVEEKIRLFWEKQTDN